MASLLPPSMSSFRVVETYAGAVPKGRFGTVRVESDDFHGTVKYCTAPTLDIANGIMREVAASAARPHICRLQCLEAFVVPDDSQYRVGVVFDRMERNLKQVLQQQARQPLVKEESVRYIAGVLAAVSYLHSLDVAHGHVSPKNVFLALGQKSPGSVKLRDVPFKAQWQDEMVYLAPEWQSPDQSPDTKADLWALGVFGVEVLMADVSPKPRLTAREDVMALLGQIQSSVKDELYGTTPDDPSLLALNPEVRLAAARVLRSHIFAEARPQTPEELWNSAVAEWLTPLKVPKLFDSRHELAMFFPRRSARQRAAQVETEQVPQQGEKPEKLPCVCTDAQAAAWNQLKILMGKSRQVPAQSPAFNFQKGLSIQEVRMCDAHHRQASQSSLICDLETKYANDINFWSFRAMHQADREKAKVWELFHSQYRGMYKESDGGEQNHVRVLLAYHVVSSVVVAEQHLKHGFSDGGVGPRMSLDMQHAVNQFFKLEDEEPETVAVVVMAAAVGRWNAMPITEGSLLSRPMTPKADSHIALVDNYIELVTRTEAQLLPIAILTVEKAEVAVRRDLNAALDPQQRATSYEEVRDAMDEAQDTGFGLAEDEKQLFEAGRAALAAEKEKKDLVDEIEQCKERKGWDTVGKLVMKAREKNVYEKHLASVQNIASQGSADVFRDVVRQAMKEENLNKLRATLGSPANGVLDTELDSYLLQLKEMQERTTARSELEDSMTSGQIPRLLEAIQKGKDAKLQEDLLARAKKEAKQLCSNELSFRYQAMKDADENPKAAAGADSADLKPLHDAIQHAVSAGIDDQLVDSAKRLKHKIDTAITRIEIRALKDSIDAIGLTGGEDHVLSIIKKSIEAKEQMMQARDGLMQAVHRRNIQELEAALLHAKAKGVHPFDCEEAEEVLKLEKQKEAVRYLLGDAINTRKIPALKEAIRQGQDLNLAAEPLFINAAEVLRQEELKEDAREQLRVAIKAEAFPRQAKINNLAIAIQMANNADLRASQLPSDIELLANADATLAQEQRKEAASQQLAEVCRDARELDKERRKQLRAALLEAREAGLDPDQGDFNIALKRLQDDLQLAICKPQLFILQKELFDIFEVCKYGILGKVKTEGGAEQEVPDRSYDRSICVICPLPSKELDPRMQTGSTKNMIEWLGLGGEPSFPRVVVEEMQKMRPRAKHHRFKVPPQDSERECICVSVKHLGAYATADEAVEFLAQAYKAIFREFAKFIRLWPGGRLRLRLLPLCGGKTSGKFELSIPRMTLQAICIGFLRLHSDDSQTIQKAEKIELCIYEEREHKDYQAPLDEAKASRLPLPGKRFRADDPTATAAPAPAVGCMRIGCGKPTWNGLPNEYCGVPCKQQDEASRPPAAGFPAGQPAAFGSRYQNCSLCNGLNPNPQTPFCSLRCKETSEGGGGGGGGLRCRLNCGRPAAAGFDTCCQSCVASKGVQHGPQCNAKNSQAGPQCQHFQLCGRPAALGYPTCCRTCPASGGKQHGPACEQAFQAARGAGAAFCPPAP